MLIMKVCGLAIAEGLVTSDKMCVRWRQVSQLYQVVTSGITVLSCQEMQSSFDKPTRAKRKGEKLWLVQPHKINVVNVAPFQSVGFNQVRKMNRHVHFFLTSVEKNQYCSTEERRRGELVAADSLFTILLSRAQKTLQAAVEEQQHVDHL